MRRESSIRPGRRKTLLARLRSEGGFGLVELLIAMVVTNIAVMALVAALSSSHVALLRASRVSTAASIANAELEKWRAVKYTTIPPTTGTATVTDSPALPTSPDGRSYTIQRTFSVECPNSPNPVTPPSTCSPGRIIKRLSVVVSDSSGVLVRQSTTYDELTGS